MQGSEDGLIHTTYKPHAGRGQLCLSPGCSLHRLSLGRCLHSYTHAWCHPQWDWSWHRTRQSHPQSQAGCSSFADHPATGSSSWPGVTHMVQSDSWCFRILFSGLTSSPRGLKYLTYKLKVFTWHPSHTTAGKGAVVFPVCPNWNNPSHCDSGKSKVIDRKSHELHCLPPIWLNPYSLWLI